MHYTALCVAVRPFTKITVFFRSDSPSVLVAAVAIFCSCFTHAVCVYAVCSVCLSMLNEPIRRNIEYVRQIMLSKGWTGKLADEHTQSTKKKNNREDIVDSVVVLFHLCVILIGLHSLKHFLFVCFSCFISLPASFLCSPPRLFSYFIFQSAHPSHFALSLS